MTENTTNKNNTSNQNNPVVKLDKYPELDDHELEVVAGGAKVPCSGPNCRPWGPSGPNSDFSNKNIVD